ncbi:MAG: ATP-binding protein [Chthonomonas sp.]|nr:ATP-binding protein [Chthonomonas sp.]
MPRLTPEELIRQPNGETSAMIRERVLRARLKQRARLGETRLNAKMTPKEIRETLVLTDECTAFMQNVAAKMQLSARVFDRILKVSRTIADLANSDQIDKMHLAEAVQFREMGG